MQTLGPINDRNLSLVAPLNADITLVGAFAFGRLSAEELRTNEPISGIDFTHWTETSLQLNKDHQIVEGFWTVQHLEAQSVFGAITINGTKVNDLSQRVLGISKTVEDNKQIAQQEHQAVCNSLDGVLERSKNFKYSLDHFEVAFKLDVEPGEQMNSFLVWQWEPQRYLVVNFGCISKLYVWNPIKGVFEEEQKIETGVVDEWLSSDDEESRIIVSNSGLLSKNCTHFGMNIWQFSNNSLQYLQKIANSADQYRLNLNQQPFRDFFFALNSKSRMVTQFDVLGLALDRWQLPAPQEDCEDVGFVFLPDRITTEIALSDGVHLSRLSPNRNSTRPKRFFEREIVESIEKWGENIRRNQKSLSKGQGPFAGLFTPENSLGTKHARNFTNADIKLKLFPADAPNVTWAGNPSTWQSQNPNTLLGAYKIIMPISSTTQSPMESKESVASEKSEDPQRTALYTKATILKNIGVQNPEEVIMAPPPAIYNEDDVPNNDTVPNHSIEHHDNATVSDGDHNPMNGSQPRIDLFGIIEKQAKKLSDRVFDSAFGKPPNTPDEDTNDDIQTQAVANGTKSHVETALSPDNISGTTKSKNSIHEEVPQVTHKSIENPETLESHVFESTTSGLNELLTEPTKSPIVEQSSTRAPDSEIAQSTETPYTQTDSLSSTFTETTNDQFTADPDADQIEPEVGGVLDVLKNVVNVVKEVPEIIHELRQDINIRHEHDKLASQDRLFNQQRHYSNPNDLYREDYLGASAASVEKPEANIGVAVMTEGGVSTTENRFLPGRIDGAEIITLEVGSDHRRTLVAISHWQKDTVKGHQDIIKVRYILDLNCIN